MGAAFCIMGDAEPIELLLRRRFLDRRFRTITKPNRMNPNSVRKPRTARSAIAQCGKALPDEEGPFPCRDPSLGPDVALGVG